MQRLVPTAGLPFRVLESIAYDPRAQEVTKIRSLKPDILLVVTRAADAIKLVRDMVRQRFGAGPADAAVAGQNMNFEGTEWCRPVNE